MARKGFKMRAVTREFTAVPACWGREPILRAAVASGSHPGLAFVELSCGHIKRDPWAVYGNETAVRVRAGLQQFQTLLHEAGRAEAPVARRCRCRECK